MITLPPKRERQRSGIPRGPQREWPRHRAWLRSHQCAVGRADCEGPVEVAHVRTAANSGVGLKPPDWDAVPLCRACHAQQHQIGMETFQQQLKVNLAELAMEFARRSPDTAMRKAMKESGDGFPFI
jgi:hypothetical protein